MPLSNTPPPLDARSKELRRIVLRMMQAADRGHLGAAFSLVEILRVLYDDILKFQSDAPEWPDRDRCILSKGHGCLALYAILADKKFFPVHLFFTLKLNEIDPATEIMIDQGGFGFDPFCFYNGSAFSIIDAKTAGVLFLIQLQCEMTRIGIRV